MQSESDFGKLESEDGLGDSRRKADERMASMLAKVKPAMPVDFDGNQEKGHAFFNTCCIYFTVVRDLFPNVRYHISYC